jgi:hypothetical protein
MAAQYAKVTDTAVNAAIISGASLDGTTVATITGASIASSLINGDVVALSAPAATFARFLNDFFMILSPCCYNRIILTCNDNKDYIL